MKLENEPCRKDAKMRELVKSMVGFSLAMSVFGIEQMRNALKKKEDKNDNREDWIRDDLATVTGAAEQRFGDRAHKVFDAGDRFQREIIDLVFDTFKSEDVKPKRMAEVAADVAEKSAEALRDAVKDDDKKSKGKSQKDDA
jgi:hypothetical protein